MTVDTDFVDIAFVAGGIEITLSGNAANTLRSIFHGLASAKPDRELCDRMFPETGVAGFRDRHEEGMRREVSGAVERVLAGFPAGNRVVLDGGGVDDWFIVLAQARWLFTNRQSTDWLDWAERGASWAVNVCWLSYLQEVLAMAALPDLG